MIVMVALAVGRGVNVGMSVLVGAVLRVGVSVIVADGNLVGEMDSVSVGRGRSVATGCVAGGVHAEILASIRISRQIFVTGFDDNENISPPGVNFYGTA
jgi:hypothetical protein